MFPKLLGASVARSLRLNSRRDARDEDSDTPPDHGTAWLLPDGWTGDFSGAAQPSPAIGKNVQMFGYEPAFPLPVDDFDSIPPGPTHSIGEGNLEELMDHLNRSGEKWDPTDPDGGVTLRIAFPQEYDDIPLHFRTLDGFDTPVDAWAEGLDFFDAEQQAFALQAAQAWTDMANVRFEVVEPGEEADIYFYAKHFDDGGAFSSGIDATHGSRVAINVADGWPDMQPGASAFRMVMHEIGHSIGMSHPGRLRRRRLQGLLVGRRIHRGHADVFHHVLQFRHLHRLRPGRPEPRHLSRRARTTST